MKQEKQYTPISKMSKAQLSKWKKWALKETLEYEQFVEAIEVEQYKRLGVKQNKQLI